MRHEILESCFTISSDHSPKSSCRLDRLCVRLFELPFPRLISTKAIEWPIL